VDEWHRSSDDDALGRSTRAFGRRARSVVVVLGGRPVVARDDAHRVDNPVARVVDRHPS